MEISGGERNIMKKSRNKIFETNSSSTHTLTITNNTKNYESKSSLLIVKFIDTNDEYTLSTLQEKVSYLVSQVINKYKFDVSCYDDLKRLVFSDKDYCRIVNYVKKQFDKQVELPNSYKGDIEEIVSINHQIAYNDLNELLESLVIEDEDSLLYNVLSSNTMIVFGRD